jgi:membrane-associated protease RseP (regulator of RpoE activity)
MKNQRFRRGGSLLLLSLAILCSSAGADEPTEAHVDVPLVMPKVVVRDNALCSFGFSLKCLGDARTKKIDRILISEVRGGTRAAELGLRPGDEILSVNGVKVADLKGGMNRDGDIMQLFVNRRKGDAIDLEVEVRVVKGLTFYAAPSEPPDANP